MYELTALKIPTWEMRGKGDQPTAPGADCLHTFWAVAPDWERKEPSNPSELRCQSWGVWKGQGQEFREYWMERPAEGPHNYSAWSWTAHAYEEIIWSQGKELPKWRQRMVITGHIEPGIVPIPSAWYNSWYNGMENDLIHKSSNSAYLERFHLISNVN